MVNGATSKKQPISWESRRQYCTYNIGQAKPRGPDLTLKEVSQLIVCVKASVKLVRDTKV